MTNSTGCPEILDLSAAPANLPLFSYLNRTGHFSVAENITLWARW